MFNIHEASRHMPKLAMTDVLNLAQSGRFARVAVQYPLILQMGLAAMPSPAVLALGKMMHERPFTLPPNASRA